MIRDATHYGAWSAILAFATAAIVFFRPGNGISSLDAANLAPAFLAAFVTFLVAFLGWAGLHYRGWHLGWIGYCLLAAGVIIVTQLLFALPFLIIEKVKPLDFVRLNAAIFIRHGWYTIPIALAGTALFVRWLKRGATAPPSPAARAGSRS